MHCFRAASSAITGATQRNAAPGMSTSSHARLQQHGRCMTWVCPNSSAFQRKRSRCISTSYKLQGDQESAGAIDSRTAHARSLVLAVDTSLDSQYAVEWVLANMFRFGDTIHLLHCVPKVPHDLLFSNPSGNLLYVPTAAFDPDEETVKAARARIAELYCKKMEAASVPYKLTIVGEEGAAFGAGVGDRVNTVAEELDADMIVVASHRKSAFAEFMMGSISNFLVHHARLPVLVLHAPRKDEDSHLRAIGTRNIVIAVDASENSVNTAKWALDNIVRHGDSVHLLHVVAAAPVRPIIHTFGDGMIVSAPYGAAGAYDETVENQAWIEEDLKKRFSELFKDADCDFNIDILMEDVKKPLESVASAICNRCEELGAAALVTASGNKGLMAEFFMGSVTSYCAHNCKSPVIVLH